MGEIKYLAEEKAVHHEAFDKIQESSRTTTTSTASRKESTSLKTESMRVEETTSSSNMTTQESVKKESVSTHSTAQLEEKMEEMRVEQYSTTQQASEYKTEHRQEESMSKESTINEESILQSTAESKDGEVVTSEHESFRTDHRQTETTTATGTETLLDEADDHVVDHDQKDQLDHKDQEGQPKKGGVKAAGVSSFPSLSPSSDPHVSKSKTVPTTVAFAHIETNLTEGVEISLDPKEDFKHSDSFQSFQSIDDLYKDKSKKKRDDKLSLEKKIQKLTYEVVGTPESPLTDSGPFTDTGISSMDQTAEKMRNRKLALDFPEPTTDTEMEYSELSPSPMGQELPPLSPIQSEESNSEEKVSIDLAADTNYQVDNLPVKDESQPGHSLVKRVQSDESSEKRRSVEDLTKYFEGRTEELKRPSSLIRNESDQTKGEMMSSVETPDKEAYNEQQVVE